MCLIGLATGLRFSKVLGRLSWEDINFNQKTLRVNRSFDHLYSRKFKDTKSDSTKRTIVIDEPTINLLLDTNLDHVTNNAVNKGIASCMYSSKYIRNNLSLFTSYTLLTIIISRNKYSLCL